jgi:hypothetical protein
MSDELIGAFADLVVSRLPVEAETGSGKRLHPSRYMLVVAVHQGAVDIEKDCLYCHARSLA